MSAQGWVECASCDGEGWLWPTPHGVSPEDCTGVFFDFCRCDARACPDCADGLVPSEAVVEAAAIAIHNKSPKCYESFGNEDDGCWCIPKARAVLVAARRAERGGE